MLLGGCVDESPPAKDKEIIFAQRFAANPQDTRPVLAGCRGKDCDIVITLFNNFSNPYNLHQGMEIDKLLASYGGNIAFYKVSFDRVGENYRNRLGICALRQNRFWQLDKLLAEHHRVSSAEDINFLLGGQAESLGIKLKPLLNCAHEALTLRQAIKQGDFARSFVGENSQILQMQIAYRDGQRKLVDQAEITLGGALFSAEELANAYISQVPPPSEGSSELGLLPLGTPFQLVVRLGISTLATMASTGKGAGKNVGNGARILTREFLDKVADHNKAVEIKNKMYLGCSYYDLGHPYTSLGFFDANWVVARQTFRSGGFVGDFKTLNGERQGDFFQLGTEHAIEELYTACQLSIPHNRHLRNIFVTNRFVFQRLVPAFKKFDEDKSQEFSRMVLFGDSLSDTGNFQNANGFLPNKPYWLGNFSNGPTWSIHLDRFLNHQLPMLNLAYGGSVITAPSTSSYTNYKAMKEYVQNKLKHAFTGDMSTMVKRYVKNNQNISANSRTLFSLWSGGNDYLRWIEEEPYKKLLRENMLSNRDYYFRMATAPILQAVNESVEELYRAGARNFLLLPIPDISLTPLCQKGGLELVSLCGKLADMHRRKLRAYLFKIQERHPEIKIIMPPLESYLSDLLRNSEQYYVTKNSEPCYNGNYGFETILEGTEITTCQGESSERSMFFDLVHPSYRVHCFLAKFFLSDIAKKWPEITAEINPHLSTDESRVSYCLKPEDSRR